MKFENSPQEIQIRRVSTHVTQSAEVLQDPDLPILLRVAEGDVESFGVLVERHQPRLWRLCERMLGSSEDAGEATQEVFLKAYRGCSAFRPNAKVSTWLYRIAVNHCLNRLRRRKLATFLSLAELAPKAQGEAPAAEWDPADSGPDAEQRLADRRRWAQVKAAIDRLPLNQRSVLVLAKLEGLSYREISQTLGITESAVESRLVRAMRRLQALGIQQGVGHGG